MSKIIARGIYAHIRTGYTYNVIGVGRLTERPTQKVVVYTQLYESTLRNSNADTKITLPINSIWVRNLEEFRNKFEKIQ